MKGHLTDLGEGRCPIARDFMENPDKLPFLKLEILHVDCEDDRYHLLLKATLRDGEIYIFTDEYMRGNTLADYWSINNGLRYSNDADDPIMERIKEKIAFWYDNEGSQESLSRE